MYKTSNDQTLNVDLYELTMAAGYFIHNHNPRVTFELFIRDLPDPRNYLIAAGLEQVIDYLENFQFTSDHINYLKSIPAFQKLPESFFEYLRELQFSGILSAVPEGSIVFANEPIVQVEAPLIEAQLVETFLLSTINFQTMIASKAARICHAARIDGQDRAVMEFGSRRAHGADAGVLAARAAYIGGCIGTSNVLCGSRFNIPVFGTTAHSWTMAFDNEREAFQKYYDIFGDQSIFLIDTYDTEQGTLNAINVARDFRAVRIDSGDLLLEAKKVRKILDHNGLGYVKIILSGDLNEHKLAHLVQQDCPVDIFGVGTHLSTSHDAPSLQVVYKLVEVNTADGLERYRAKFSENKVTLPGKKQIWRYHNLQGKLRQDLLSLAHEDYSVQANPLLDTYIINGQPVKTLPSAKKIRQYALDNLKKLPSELLDLNHKSTFPVHLSEDLKEVLDKLRNQNSS